MLTREKIQTVEEIIKEVIPELKSEFNLIQKQNVKEFLLPAIEQLQSCLEDIKELNAKIEYPDDDGVPF